MRIPLKNHHGNHILGKIFGIGKKYWYIFGNLALTNSHQRNKL